MKAAFSKKITLENATNTEMVYWDRLGVEELMNSASVELFERARTAGFIEWQLTNQAAVDFCDAEPNYELRPAAPLAQKARLAYWCVRASTYLGLDKGRMQKNDKPRTHWKPFEKAFGVSGTPLRLCLHLIDESPAPEDYTALIDQFFAALEASDNEQK